MKLMSVTLGKYKRFEESTEIDVAGDVIALVGPNEAGKSSILDAMLSFDRRRAFNARERTRNSQGETSVMAGFVLDDADRIALSDIPGGIDVRWWTFEIADESEAYRRTFHLRPAPSRDLSRRHECAGRLKEFGESEHLERFNSIGNLVVADLYEAALVALDDKAESLSDDQQEAIQRFATTMFRFDNICTEPDPAADNQISADFCALLHELTEYSEGDSPHTLAGRILVERMPKFVMFTSEDRNLQTTYDLSEVAQDTPVALSNLAQLAGLDLQVLLNAVQVKDRGRREDLVEQANERLRTVFRESWGQSDLTVRMAIQDDVLEVLISIPGGGYSEIQERSDGLRSFVALRGFLSKKNLNVPPILLVDEAEQHLHYDAQANLVDLFTEQNLAAKVIYSTHSAGCLPRDLGNGIRVVVPEVGKERSRVKNSVWGGRKAGFTPLIYGMGATTFAFLPARFVVLGEGPSDAMLYPTLFREAIEPQALNFQVAPGLATVAPGNLSELTTEGGRVVFLTDGDEDGGRYRKALEDGGVPQERILGLDELFGEPLHLEDLIDPEVYAVVVNDILRDFQQPKSALGATDMPEAGRIDAVKKWCKRRGLTPPDKVDVAQRLLDRKAAAARVGDNLTLISPHRREGMQQLHERIRRIFDPAAR